MSLFEAVDGVHILIQMVVGLVLHKMLIASQQQEAMGHPGANTIFQASTTTTILISYVPQTTLHSSAKRFMIKNSPQAIQALDEQLLQLWFKGSQGRALKFFLEKCFYT